MTTKPTAHCTAGMADFLDPTGMLQKAGLLLADIKKPREWGDLWDAMDANPELWIDITEHMFDEMLNVLPPVAMGGGGFLVGEPSHHNDAHEEVYVCFVRSGDDYQARYMTVREFRIYRGIHS